MSCFKDLEILENDPLPYAYFKLDDDPTTKTAIEEIAGFNLTSTNVYSQWPTAKIGTALWDPWLRLSDSVGSSHWDFAATGFTVRLWFEMGTVPVNNTFFILNVNSDPANVTEWELSLQSAIGPLRQFPRFRMVLSGGDAIVDGPDLTDTTSFHRLIFGWEKGVGVWLKFDNGATITTANTNLSLNGGILTKFFLGPTNESQSMGIDEVAIWNRTLTPTEIDFDWNGGAGRTYP